MRKIVGLLIVSLLLCGGAYAVDLQVGVDTEFVLNRRLDMENAAIKVDYSAQYYDAVAAIRLAEFLTIGVKAGLNHSRIEADIMNTEVELNSGIGWNIGCDVEADLFTDPFLGIDLSVAGSYRFARNDIDEIVIGAIQIDNPIETILYTHAWEIGAYASRDLNDIVGVSVIPYIGVAYSDLHGDIDINLLALNLDEDLNARNHVGLRCGIASEVGGLSLSLDMKFIDETALCGKVSYRF